MKTGHPSSAERALIAWIRSSDAILKGLNHAFSNQLSLIRLLSQLVKAGEVVDAELQQAAQEAAHLDLLLGHYRLLPFAAEGVAEPIRVLDVTNDAIALLQHDEAMRDMTCLVQGDQDTSPVLLNPAALTQAIVLLLSAAARRAPVGVTGAGLVLRYGGDAEWVWVSVDVSETPASDEPTDAPELEAVRWLTRDAEGSAEFAPMPDGGRAVRMRVGTLQRLRQRARRG